MWLQDDVLLQKQQLYMSAARHAGSLCMYSKERSLTVDG